jgi:hypothetical protein
MTNFMSMFFGPLDKSSCVYFLILTIIFFVGLVILIANELLYILQNLNKLNVKMLTSGFIIMFNIFVAYFVNRLLYTMCSKSLA